MRNFYLRLASSIFIAPIFLYAVYEANFFFYFLLAFILSASFYEIIKNVKQKILLLFLLLLVCFFIFSFIEVRGSGNRSFILLVWIFLIVWSSDIFGYLVGKAFGGPKLSKHSPNKTISGFFGSVFFSQMSIIFPYFLLEGFVVSFRTFLLQLTLAIISIYGDIFFSKIKRLNNIKDYSALIPGHGGILDRIDGMIFAIITYYLIIFFNVL